MTTNPTRTGVIFIIALLYLQIFFIGPMVANICISSAHYQRDHKALPFSSRVRP